MRKAVAPVLVLLLSTYTAAELDGATDDDEPFGMTKSMDAPDSSTTGVEWKKVITDADTELQKLDRCRARRDCNSAEEKYSSIVKEARNKEGRAKIEYVHNRINGEIRYEADPTQWGLPDHWSLPVDAEGKGSLNTGVGGCEDYFLANLLDSPTSSKPIMPFWQRATITNGLSSTIGGTVYTRTRTSSNSSLL
jgi:predicted transglutaminase-like cysteine proteinase